MTDQDQIPLEKTGQILPPELAKKYFHIPKEVRAKIERKRLASLPSEEERKSMGINT